MTSECTFRDITYFLVEAVRLSLITVVSHVRRRLACFPLTQQQRFSAPIWMNVA